jgi:ATP-binding cassette subfamily F protein 3
VLLITHDPDLVELVADRLWLVADGTVRAYEGDLDDYRSLLVERARPARAETPTRRDDRRDRAEARQALAPLRRKAKDAEATIQKLTAERAALEAKLADPKMYAAGKAADVTAANTRLAAIARAQAEAEAAWLAAEEAMEAAG